jgi:hypothetical protein
MSKSKHTPGPWISELEIAGQNHKTHIRASKEHGSIQVCEINRAVDLKLDGANARLIACAPEMLDFIRRIIAEQESHGEHGDAVVIRDGRNLIARAEGTE